MTTNASAALYHESYVATGYERLLMFVHLGNKFVIERVLYPGCYVHVTPSFVFPDVVYVDNDKQAKKFFANAATAAFINESKLYTAPTSLRFLALDYTADLGEPEESFDLLISQYAGFISQHCKRYLRVGGILLVNNSHGDASMASLDSDYALIAVVLSYRGRERISEKDLEAYFQPKKPQPVTKARIAELGRGIAYKKSAAAYLFRRIR
jgi:hypothetical protein